jgi:hypothetical protein
MIIPDATPEEITQMVEELKAAYGAATDAAADALEAMETLYDHRCGKHSTKRDLMCLACGAD